MANSMNYTREQIAAGIMTYMQALELQDEQTLLNTFRIESRNVIKAILKQLVADGSLERKNNIYIYVNKSKPVITPLTQINP